MSLASSSRYLPRCTNATANQCITILETTKRTNLVATNLSNDLNSLADTIDTRVKAGEKIDDIVKSLKSPEKETATGFTRAYGQNSLTAENLRYASSTYRSVASTTSSLYTYQSNVNENITSIAQIKGRVVTFGSRFFNHTPEQQISSLIHEEIHRNRRNSEGGGHIPERHRPFGFTVKATRPTTGTVYIDAAERYFEKEGFSEERKVQNRLNDPGFADCFIKQSGCKS